MTRKHTRRTVRPLVDPISLAIDRAGLLSAGQQAQLMVPARAAVEAMARGAGSVATWQQCADVLNLAEALCELSIANNLAATVTQAQAALANVMQRVKAGRGWTLYGPELAALREGLWLYSVQISLCSVGEHLRAIELVHRRISAALAGNAGPRARVHQAPTTTEPRAANG